MSSPIRIDTVSNPPQAVVLIRGEIDAATGPVLAATIDDLPAAVTMVELDVTEVTFIDSTGLGVIAALINRLQPVGGRITIRNPSEMVVRLLNVTDLMQFVTIVDDRRD